MYHFNPDPWPEDEDISFPGQDEHYQTELLQELNEQLKLIKSENSKEAEYNNRRFKIQLMISLFALIASVIAAIAALIPVLSKL